VTVNEAIITRRFIAMDLFAGWFAVHVTRDDARSALPHAPVRRDRLGQWLGAIRRGSAGVLHRLADRLDSHPTLVPDAALRDRCAGEVL
jgi:hypothetical protein